MQRVFVYIDGRNFFYSLRDMDLSYTDLNFDFVKFSELINGINWNNRKLEKINYYNASLKQNVNQFTFQQQQRLFARLRNNPLVEVKLCKMLRRTDSRGNQRYDTKGDDIWIACDMLQDANDNKFDIAILVSCDGDFLKLVEYVQNLNKTVENAYFLGAGSRALRNQCGENNKIGIGLDLIEDCMI